MNNQFKVYASIILSMLFWSFSFVWVKIVYQVYNPISTVFIRLIISSILLFIFAISIKKLQKIDKSDYKILLSLAFFEPFLYFLGESFGLKMISSTMGAVIISTIPLFSPIVAYYLYKERVSSTNIIGILISIIGVGLIIYSSSSETISSPLGIALMGVAVFAAVAYSSRLKLLVNKYNAITLISYQNLIGIFLFLPLFLFFDLNNFIEAKPNKEVIIAILQLSVFASSIAFIFFTYGLKHLGITKSNIFINMIPAFTAIFAYYILDEKISKQMIVGISIVILGLFLSQQKLKKEKNELV